MHNDVKTRQRGNLAQYQSVANVLKVRMITIGMKQNELADRLKISQSRVSNYLNGKSEPDFYTLSKMAEYLRISLNDLVLNSGTLVGGEMDKEIENPYSTGDTTPNEEVELHQPQEQYMPFVVAKKLKVRESIASARNFVSLPPQIMSMINAPEDVSKKDDDGQVVILEVTEKIYSSKIVVNSGDLVFAVPYTVGMDVGGEALLIKPGKRFSVVKLSQTLSTNGEQTYTALQEHSQQNSEATLLNLSAEDLEGYLLVTAVLQVM